MERKNIVCMGALRTEGASCEGEEHRVERRSIVCVWEHVRKGGASYGGEEHSVEGRSIVWREEHRVDGEEHHVELFPCGLSKIPALQVSTR